MSDLSEQESVNGEIEFLEDNGNTKRKGQSVLCRIENKKRKYSGEEHETSFGKVQSKTFNILLKCCKKECCRKVSALEQENLFNQFYANCSKEQQDVHLSGLMTNSSPSTHVVAASKPRASVWKFLVRVNGVEQSVCRQFLCVLYQISVKRLRVIQQKVIKGDIFVEKRGSHTNRPRTIEKSVWDLVREHLALIPQQESHYSRNKSQKKYFLNPNLSVKKLFDLFCIYYKEKMNSALKLSYKTYHKFFKHELNYGFKLPRSDICDFCSECIVKLNSNPNDFCKTLYEIHQRKYQAYKTIHDKIITESRNSKNILVLQFDYAQNLPLPKTNETLQFYKRLLWVYLFNIHCHNDNSSVLYYFLEVNGKKNPDSVCSFLLDFIKQKITNEVNEIHLLSDAAGGQNKNLLMTTFCSWLSMEFGVRVVQLFPVRGHSFNICDRNFGLCGQKMKKEEKIHSLGKYLELIESARTNPSPFIVKNGTPILKKFSVVFKDVMLKKPRSGRTAFKIQSYPRLSYPCTGGVLASTSYTGQYQPFTYFKKHDLPMNLEEQLQPVDAVKINPLKEVDIRSLFKFLKQEDIDWFEEVFK